MSPLQPRQPSPRETEKSSAPSGRPKEREFNLPGEREREKPSDEVVEAFEKEKKSLVDEEKEAQARMAAMQTPLDLKQPGLEAAKELSKTEAISPFEAQKGVDQIARLIKQMVEAMRIGTVEGRQITSIDLKQSTDFLSQANLTMTTLAEGRIAVSISNLDQANMIKAINAVEQNKVLLDKLSTDLQAKGIILAEVRIGETVVYEATPGGVTFETTSLGAQAEGFRERQEREQEGEPGEEGEGRR